MSAQPTVAFVLNQVQDINTVRGLVYLAAREFEADILLLTSRRFFTRDARFVWSRELMRLAADTKGRIRPFWRPHHVAGACRGRRGIAFAASESDVSAHKNSRMALTAMPPSFLRATLQHGHECVGFLHNRAHVAAHGENAVFAADVVCAWSEGSALPSLAPSQRAKLLVTGPPTLLQEADHSDGQTDGEADDARGLVCENLHSPRLNASGNHGTAFLDAFDAFSAALAKEGRHLVLRPHPGGRYVLKNGVPIPGNVTCETRPIYRVDLSRHAYGISAPSTVLVDMMLAGIPVAVWRDAAGGMDITNYRGLPTVSTADEWLVFDRAAQQERERMIAAQERILSRLGLMRDRAEIYTRFARLIDRALTPRAGTRSTGARMIGTGSIGKDDTGTDRRAAPAPAGEATGTATPRRIMFIANDLPLPTLEISFLHPLSPLIETGAIVARCVEEFDLRALAKGRRGPAGQRPIDTLVAEFDPDLIVFCRYSGPYTDVIVNAARAMGRPVIFHIDDDLLNVPRALGVKKFVRHNLPPRKRALRYLLSNADLIYVSTAPLAARLENLGVTQPMVRGALVCAADVIAPAEARPVKTIGYMGFDHAHDLKMVLPDLIAFLDEHEEVAFELFGSIPVPSALKRFGPRVRRLRPVRGYDAFMQAFAARRWEIGICPLQPTAFNRLKANNKWVEYTAVGAAVIASCGMVYDTCCAEGCGVLIDGAEGWRDALQHLTRNPDERAHMVARAQRRLEQDYTPARLRHQVLDVFNEAAAQARTAQWTSH